MCVDVLQQLVELAAEKKSPVYAPTPLGERAGRSGVYTSLAVSSHAFIGPFSKLCQIIYRNIQNVVTYVDDFMATATNHQEMIKLLITVFEECKYHGMKLNLKKCILGL